MSADVIKYSIIATDYESYALVHGCKEHYDVETDEFKVVVFNHIWSRSKTLDEGVVKTLKSVFSSFDVFEDEWIDIDNSAC
jgi:predicted PolB exonuclease-like 3'-5' exonuclease